MGNGIGKLSICFTAGGSRRRREMKTTSYSSNPLDEGLGHSFCYIPPPKSNFTDDPPTTTTTSAAFRTISGASISANASTPLSTSLVDIGPYGIVDKASAFESSHLFSSIPLQPVPRSSLSSVRSGPIPRVSGPGSGPMERGFLSGPIERSFTSGPLEIQYDTYKPRAKRWAYVNSLKKVISKSLWGSGELSWPEKPEQPEQPEKLEKHNPKNHTMNNYYYFSGTNSNTTSNSNTLSSQASLFDDEYDDNNESFRSQNVQWAQGKAGEDRVHIVISEEYGWVFVGIYDGFNGPDATDFLLNNLYSNVYKELKGLFWSEKSESSKNSSVSESIVSSCDINSAKEDLGWKLRAKLNKFGCDDADNNHSDVLKALSEGLRKTEESYLEIADMMVMENPELALMGSCVLVMLMKGEDVYLMNVGDSRAVLARKIESEQSSSDFEFSDGDGDGDEFSAFNTLTSCQLTMDHCTSVKQEVQRIRREHPDDASAVTNDRVKGSLKVTRAFGAGFLKQPKWNNALLEMFRIDYVGNSPYINCSPHMYHHRLGARDRFLILSSDGLYQYFTNEEAVTEVEVFMSTFPEGDPAQHLVEEVLFRAAKKAGMDFYELLDIPQGDRRKYHDDVSIIIISFEGRMWKSSV